MILFFRQIYQDFHLNMSKTIRWGIASAGKISHDFTNAILGPLPSDEHKVKYYNMERVKNYNWQLIEFFISR